MRCYAAVLSRLVASCLLKLLVVAATSRGSSNGISRIPAAARPNRGLMQMLTWQEFHFGHSVECFSVSVGDVGDMLQHQSLHNCSNTSFLRRFMPAKCLLGPPSAVHLAVAPLRARPS